MSGDTRFLPTALYLVETGHDGAICELVTGDRLQDVIHEQFCCCDLGPLCAEDGYYQDFLKEDEWSDSGWHVSLEDGFCTVHRLTTPPAVYAELDRVRALLNTPETEDFDKGVPLEAAHQVVRWGDDHDAGKDPADWFWLVGYLAGKALAAHISGNTEKAKHHCISTAAVLRNWHAHIRSGETVMRPGIAEDKTAALEVEDALGQFAQPVK